MLVKLEVVKLNVRAASRLDVAKRTRPGGGGDAHGRLIGAVVAAAPAVHRRRLLQHAFARLLELRLSHAGLAQVAAYP